MGLKLNPLTAQFDLTGSGGGGASYIDGEVAIYNDLPLDGTAPLNSAWLVRTASGVWPVSRKQAGIYIRTATAGSSRDADYTYAGTMPDVFSDAVFLLYDEASTTRTGQFNLGNITAGQNRVLTWPDANGTIARTETFAAPPAIGNTTPSTGAFTTLSANNGTLTASAPVLDLAQTWNNGSVNFDGALFTITNTASGANSNFIRFLRGSTGVILFGRDGRVTARDGFAFNPDNFNTRLVEDGSHIVAQRNGTNAQTFNIYNTFTSATNHERGFLRWSSNVFQIGTEKGSGGGSARALEFQTDGVTRMTIASNGNVTFANFLSVNLGTNGALSAPGGVSANADSAIWSGHVVVGPSGRLHWRTAQWNVNSYDLALERDAAGTLGIRDGTNPQTFNLYNTFTSSTNHERGFLRWSSNVFQIGTEKGSGGGSARDLVLQTDGTTRYTLAATTGQLSSQNSRIILDDANTVVHIGNTPRISLYGVASPQLALGNAADIRWSNTGRSDQAASHNISLVRDADGILAQRAGTTAQTWRLYNTVSGTNNVNFDRVNFRWASNEFIIDAEAGGTGTLRGIKIGSATSSLLGFYGATPVDRPATVADPAGGGTVDAEARTAINTIIDRLQELGLIA